MTTEMKPQNRVQTDGDAKQVLKNASLSQQEGHKGQQECHHRPKHTAAGQAHVGK